jgi:hypothetical protein
MEMNVQINNDSLTNQGSRHLEEKLHSLEIRMSALMNRRKAWETREYQLKKVLWVKTGELAVLSDYFNNQAHERKERV